MNKALLLLGIFLLNFLSLWGCASANYEHVNQVSMEIPAGPEVRGASSYQKSKMGNLRISGNVHLGKSEKIDIKGITNEPGDCKEMEDCLQSEFTVDNHVDASYETSFPIVTGSLEYLYKDDIVLWSVGGAINDGFFAFASGGINTEFFEFGVSIGFWGYYRKFEYSGIDYSCSSDWEDNRHLYEDPFGDSNNFGFALVPGLYAGAYYDKLSLNFSINTYKPDLRYNTSELHAAFKLPSVISEYLTVGYKFNQRLELRIGAANVFGDFEGWHWSVISGLSFNFLS